MTKKIIVTGGCGFIGHHFIEHILKETDWYIYIIDKLTYSSFGFDRLKDIEVFNDRRIQIFTSDFSKPVVAGMFNEIKDAEYIVHLGAETHVDKSIEDPEPFVRSNVLGTMHILQMARRMEYLRRMVYFSTDEIFGPAPKGVKYKEWDRYNSTNPYSASKAGGEELALAWANTYKVPVMITHTMNVFGERQHPEKFIPMTVKNVIDGNTVKIHSDSTRTVSGSRHWIHARNVAGAIMFLLRNGNVREKYNIVGEEEVSNLEMAGIIAQIIGKELKYEMVDFHSSRPGHDLRYSLDGTKLKQMGYQFPKGFRESLEKTILWMIEHPRWAL